MSGVDLRSIKSDGYEIVFGRHALAQLAEYLSADSFSGVKLFILVDENTLKNCLPNLIAKVAVLRNAEVIEISSGEESKNIEVCDQIWKVLSELGADRSSIILNLGGGVISDIGGFVAGTFKRGIRFINIPTSLLAQVDASVGGKTGINSAGLKNEVGIFNTPEKVFVDPEFLETLPHNELRSGFAEVIKHALIFDADYWLDLKNFDLFDTDAIADVVARSVEIKNEIVSSDPFETGQRKILNFGHTVGHAVESFSFESDMRAVLHGEAVAMGMCCESFIAHKQGLLSEADLQEITGYIFNFFPRIELDPVAYHRIIELMRHDKKNRNGRIHMTLLGGIGLAVPDRQVKIERILDSLNFYARWVSG